jgi:hypothetical protein
VETGVEEGEEGKRRKERRVPIILRWFAGGYQ